MDNDNHVSVDIENLAASLRQELEALHPLSEHCCIYRVPNRLRQSNEKVYTPQIVSLGPFHHEREELRAMEDYKKRYLIDFVNRAQVSLEELIQVVGDKEERLLSSYAETIKFISADFVKMILVDAAFIIEVLLRYNFPRFINASDRVYNTPGLIHDIWDDMWILENQLPFFILEDLYKKANIEIPDTTERPSMLKLTHKFCKQYRENFGIEEEFNESIFTDHEMQHLLDFLRLCILPSEFQFDSQVKRPRILTTPSVTELYQAGVEIKIGRSKNMFDIRFSKGKLEIPQIKIRAATELILKNLLAFEQCHFQKYPINDYVVIIKYLVNTPNDVELLVQKGIMENWLENSEGVSTLFHNLVQWTIYDLRDFHFSSLVEDLNNYCKTPWHRWKATLKQDYFNTPWASISVIAAVILLLLTVFQTVSPFLGL